MAEQAGRSWVHPTKPPAQSRAAPARWLDRATGGLLAAVIVCRLLTPTDAAAVGETIWIAQLALLALLVWVLAVHRSGVMRLCFGWVDGSVLLFCLGHIVGALVVVATDGDKRAALNMLWEWCGVGATYFLMRQMLTSPAARCSLLLVIAAAAVSLSGLGMWQHYRGFAGTRRDYDKTKAELESLERSGRPADSDAALNWDRAMQRVRADLVEMGVPTDDSARMMWEQRLNSIEPIGMFALANTLAGILAALVLVWLGLVLYGAGAVPRWQLIVGAFLTALVLYCLLLTKSRTAYVGLFAGLTVWAAGARRWNSIGMRRRGWWLAAGFVAAIALIVAAAATGGLDRFVVSEAAKSLRYRSEFWQSTWRMLIDRPKNWIIGVGPGNFRQSYLKFKLPESSEEIADPHNLLLDVWANGGLVALVGLAGVLAAGLQSIRFGPAMIPADEETEPSWRDGILAGGVLGHLAVLVPGGVSEEIVILLLLAWLCVVSICRIFFRRELPPVVFAAAFTALAVHLLGAGGIAMPAVSQILLFLVILGRANVGAGGWTYESSSRWPVIGAGVTAMGLYLGCWMTGLAPVVGARSKLASGEYELYQNGRPSLAERNFRLAAEADPWAAEPCERLSELAFRSWLASEENNEPAFARCLAWQQKAIALNPKHPGGFRVLGQMYLSRFGRTRAPADASAAAAAYAQAVGLYPNHAQTQSELAGALLKAGEVNEARAAAGRALELDAVNEKAGHVDKQLRPSRREMMKKILDEEEAIGRSE
jgi:hypothetical protein